MLKTSSRSVLALLALLYVGAFLCVLLVQLPLVARLLLLLLLLASAVYSFCSNSISHFSLHSDGLWRLRLKCGKEETAELLDDSYLSRWLLVLNFRVTDSKRRRSAMITANALATDAYRKLLQLRFK